VYKEHHPLPLLHGNHDRIICHGLRFVLYHPQIPLICAGEIGILHHMELSNTGHKHRQQVHATIK